MPIDSLTRVELPIEREDDVLVVRRRARELAVHQKFDSFAAAAVTTATSELARNVLVHATKGAAILEEVTDGARMGIGATFRDEGQGFVDLERALAGGYSTARSMGLGLSGSKRLVDEFDIKTAKGQGTVVTFVKWRPY